MATVSIVVIDRPEGGISILIDAGEGELETGAQIVAGMLADMLENLIEIMKRDAELSKVPIKNGCV
jgi:hypothetical protein